MRLEKKAYVDLVRNEVQQSNFLILADFRGLTVAKAEDLRRRLQRINARFRVVKNSMLRQVVRELPCQAVEQSLEGPSAMVTGAGDVVDAAKVLKDFIKENTRPKVKAGALDGAVLSSADVLQMAELPPKKVMQAILVGTIAAPMARLVGVCQQKVASLLYVLNAVVEKKGKPEPQA